jgi:hypothetical protein
MTLSLKKTDLGFPANQESLYAAVHQNAKSRWLRAHATNPVALQSRRFGGLRETDREHLDFPQLGHPRARWWAPLVGSLAIHPHKH